jgi:hypothetical protein
LDDQGSALHLLALIPIAATLRRGLVRSVDHESAEGLLLRQVLLEQIVQGIDLWRARCRPVVMVECPVVVGGAPGRGGGRPNALPATVPQQRLADTVSYRPSAAFVLIVSGALSLDSKAPGPSEST